MSTDLEEIKQRLNVVDLISSYLPLKKAGRNYRGLCPFHHEKTPSFMVSPERQIWHCFGCSSGGDIFSFVMQMEGVEFPEALRILAEKAGVTLQKSDLAKFAKTSREKELILKLNLLAGNFYHYILTKTKTGKNALDYLLERNLTPEIIKRFTLGYAPEKLDLFYRFASSKGYSKDDLLLAGLIVKSEFFAKSQTNYIDKFRGRIIFPIWDTVGNTVGFTGRILKDKKDAPKYLNSPETPAFNKSLILYGLNFAREAIRKKDRVILVEGNMDVVTSHQYGILETVASSGTSTTRDQFILLSRYTPNIIIAFDADEAGIAAAKRASILALTEGIEIKFVEMPEGVKDPDEALKKDAKIYLASLESPQNLIEFLFKKAKTKEGKLDTNAKRKLSSELLPIIKAIQDPILKGEYLQKLADTLELKIEYLEDAIKKSKKLDIGDSPILKTVEKPQDFRRDLEEKIIGIALAFFPLVKKNLSCLKPEEFITSFARNLFLAIEKYQKIHKTLELEDFLKKLPGEFKKKVDFLLLSIEGEFDNLDEETIKCEFAILAKKFLNLQTSQITEEFAAKIKAAEEKKDVSAIKKLVLELHYKLKSKDDKKN